MKKILGQGVQRWQLARIIAALVGGGGSGGGATLEAGDVVFSLATLSEPEWLTPGDTYSATTYPDASTVFGLDPADIGTFTIDRTFPGAVYYFGEYDGKLFVCGNSTQIHAYDPTNGWVSYETGSSSNFLQGVAFGNGVYVIVSSSGYISYSTDLTTWTELPAFANGFRYLVFALGKFYTVDNTGAGAVWDSVDGSAWNESALSPDGLSYIGFHNNLLIASGQNGFMATSPDGSTWTPRDPGFGTSYVYGVAYGEGLYVAVGGDGKTAYSSDLTNWTLNTLAGVTGVLTMVYYSNGQFIVSGQNGYLTKSTDGINWTDISSETTADSNEEAIFYGGNAYVGNAVGSIYKAPTSSGTTFTTPEYTTDTGYNAYVYSGVTA